MDTATRLFSLSSLGTAGLLALHVVVSTCRVTGWLEYIREDMPLCPFALQCSRDRAGSHCAIRLAPRKGHLNHRRQDTYWNLPAACSNGDLSNHNLSSESLLLKTAFSLTCTPISLGKVHTHRCVGQYSNRISEYMEVVIQFIFNDTEADITTGSNGNVGFI